MSLISAQYRSLILLVPIALSSCDFSQTLDLLDEDARISCDTSEHKEEVSNSISVVAERNGFEYLAILEHQHPAQFVAVMTSGPAEIYIRNLGEDDVSINSSITPYSDQDIYDGKDIDLVVEELSLAITEACRSM